MEQYIPKSIVVAEIDNFLDKGKYHDDYECAFRDGNNAALYTLKERINALEVREINLDKEYEKYVEEDPVYNKFVNSIVGKSIAKHFFELGLKVNKVEDV